MADINAWSQSFHFSLCASETPETVYNEPKTSTYPCYILPQTVACTFDALTSSPGIFYETLMHPATAFSMWPCLKICVCMVDCLPWLVPSWWGSYPVSRHFHQEETLWRKENTVQHKVVALDTHKVLLSFSEFLLSLIPRPSSPRPVSDHFCSCILQVIKNWMVGRPSNNAN